MRGLGMGREDSECVRVGEGDSGLLVKLAGDEEEREKRGGAETDVDG